MNRYEVTVSHFFGHEQTSLGMWTVHAGTPRVALQRVIQRRLTFPMGLAPNAGMISLKFDVVNRGKVIHIEEVRWVDCRGYIGTVRINDITYSTHDDAGDCQIEHKTRWHGSGIQYIMAGEPIPEGWEVYRQNEPQQYRFKPGADLAILSAGYLANKEG